MTSFGRLVLPSWSPDGGTFENDLRAAIGSQDIDVRGYQRRQGNDRFWVQGVPYGWQAVTVWLAALALFGTMLTGTGHRYANRWAWFWMFLTGPLGMIGYLWLEKRPFPPPRPLFTGPPPSAAAPDSSTRSSSESRSPRPSPSPAGCSAEAHAMCPGPLG